MTTINIDVVVLGYAKPASYVWRGVAEYIYREIHGLSYLDNARLTWEVHDDTFWILWGII